VTLHNNRLKMDEKDAEFPFARFHGTGSKEAAGLLRRGLGQPPNFWSTCTAVTTADPTIGRGIQASAFGGDRSASSTTGGRRGWPRLAGRLPRPPKGRDAGTT